MGIGPKPKPRCSAKSPDAKFECKRRQALVSPKTRLPQGHQMNTPAMQEVLPEDGTALHRNVEGDVQERAEGKRQTADAKDERSVFSRARVCGQLLAGSRCNGNSTHDKSYLKSPIGARARFVRDPGPARTRGLSWFSMNQLTALLYPRHRAYGHKKAKDAMEYYKTET